MRPFFGSYANDIGNLYEDVVYTSYATNFFYTPAGAQIPTVTDILTYQSGSDVMLSTDWYPLTLTSYPYLADQEALKSNFVSTGLSVPYSEDKT